MRWEVFIWAVFALVLIIGEVVAPGAFMLWLGLAAAAVMVLVWVLPGLSVLWQAVAFVVLAVISIQISRSWFRNAGRASDQPLLNRRAEQLVGQIHSLDTAIVDGRGRLKIGDAYWAVEGPDLPVRASVRIVAVHGMSLLVQPAD
jgi:membrane protein implicated in regulation of membrane protease activity